MKPKKVVLCGSSRFRDQHMETMKAETLKGHIVLPMGMFGHCEGLDMDGPVKKMLDELHLRKIDESDEVLVVDPSIPTCTACGIPCSTTGRTHRSQCCGEDVKHIPYIGSSTRNEIVYAESIGRPFRYLSKEK